MQVNIKQKALSSGAIPHDCKLTQAEVEELIEECKLLLMQSKSIVDYSN